MYDYVSAMNDNDHKNGITSSDNFQCSSRQKLCAVVSPQAASVSTYCASNNISTNKHFQKLARAASMICSHPYYLLKCYFCAICQTILGLKWIRSGSSKQNQHLGPLIASCHTTTPLPLSPSWPGSRALFPRERLGNLRVTLGQLIHCNSSHAHHLCFYQDHLRSQHKLVYKNCIGILVVYHVCLSTEDDLDLTKHIYL